MCILTVAYGHPSEPSAFDEHYACTHRPFVVQVPGLAGFTARRCAAFDGSEPPFYAAMQPQSPLG